MEFGTYVDDLKSFNLSSDRFLNIQNGRHYDVIIRNHRFGDKYNFVNNAWIHLKVKLYIVNFNAVI